MQSARRAALACLALLLTSCAQLPGPETDAWQEHSARLLALTQWHTSGKIAVRSPERSESATLEWQQHGPVTRIFLTGPLGVGATTIESNQHQLTVQRDGTSHTYDLSSSDAIATETGWDIPLDALPYWIRGLPSPGSDTGDKTFDNNLLRSLRQQGWLISFERYGRFGQYTLPTRMTIERDDTRARLILRSWSGLVN